MKIAIDITEAINGWRLDIIEDNKSWKENVTTLNEVFVLLQHYAEKQLRRKLPTHTMDVI